MYEKTSEYAGNLLAVMHSDGGHYISEHGWKKATDDAIEKYYALTSERDEAVRERDELRAKAALATTLRGNVGLAYISERAVYEFIYGYDSLTTDKTAQGRTGKETA